MLPVVMAPCLFVYRVVVLDTKKEFQSYIRTISEGSVVEWAGFLLLIASAFLVWRTALAWERSIEKWVLSVLAAGLFLVGMEEMSWGQMIFNWQPPKLVNDINVSFTHTCPAAMISKNIGYGQDLVGIFPCIIFNPLRQARQSQSARKTLTFLL